MEVKPRQYVQAVIPGMDDKQVNEHTGGLLPISQNRKKLNKTRQKSKLTEESIQLSIVENVEFSLFSTGEIDAYSVVDCTTKESVYDLRMGPHDSGSICPTCSNDIRGCPGHYGKIVLPKIMHPLCVQTILHVLSCINIYNSKLLVTEKMIEDAGISRYSGNQKLTAVKSLVKGNEYMYRRYKLNKNAHFVALYAKRDDKVVLVGKLFPNAPGEIEGELFPQLSLFNILRNISNVDAGLLGFTNSRPENMIIDRLIVIPYCARPDIIINDEHKRDDLTTMYRLIIEAVDKIKQGAPSSSSLDNIFLLTTHLMKNDAALCARNFMVQTDIQKRIQGKTGLIRGNLMGKNVNFAGRTVVGPGYYLRVDEVGVPVLMAQKLLRPVKITEFNRSELQAKYDAGSVPYITKLAGIRAYMKGKSYRLQVGDIAERYLQDGDVVLVNRQPSLHKQNFIALYVRLINERIARINLSITTPLGADFDGDEINIHVPQTIEAYAEAEQIVGVYNNLMSEQTNRPMLGLVYDTLSGVYLLTHPQEEYDKLSEQLSPEELESLEQKITFPPDVFNVIISNVINTPQFGTLVARLNRYGVPIHTGRALVSACLPEGFDYKRYDNSSKTEIIIKDGILIRGVLTKDTVGNKDGSIIAEMVKQMGSDITIDFMSNIQFVTRDFLQQHGLSIGITDCMSDDPTFKQNLDEILATATMKVISLAGPTSNTPSGRLLEEQRERKIMNTLDIAKNKGSNIVSKLFKPDNAILIMANSGSKGTVLNAVQMSSALGQQKVSGKRIKANLLGDRSLPSVQPGSKDPRDLGMCFNSFSSGLEPKEFFFHAQGGREGLTDTAINTADTGHLQRRIIKSAEDIHISPDGSVRSVDDSIVQFIYGDDGFNPAELGSVNILDEQVPLFRNINNLVFNLNRKYE